MSKKEYQKRYYKKHRDKWREKHLVLRRGITVEEFDVLIYKQHFRCAICDEKLSKDNRQVHVDHNHKTGQVRGILCRRCNLAIGSFNDDIAILMRAVAYLSKDYGKEEKAA